MSSTDPTTEEADLVRCDITGQMVSRDDVVTLHGYTVCAEGKAELLEKLRSGELLPGELARPTALRRFACLFVDGLIIGVVNFGVMFFVGTSATMTEPEGDMSAVATRLWLATAFMTAVSVAYLTFFHGKWGQTLGKMAGKIKVVTSDGEPISMQQAFVRALLYQGPGLLMIVPGFLLVSSEVWMNGINVLASLYFVVSVILALTDRARQRAIHDRLGKTRVVTLS